jgi:autotransporter-associated beta strand protein
MGETHLGNINVQGGRLYIGGSTTMGDAPGTIRISNNALLGVWLPNTVTHSKAIVVESTGGEIEAYSDTGTFTSTITLEGNLTAWTRSGSTLNLNGVITGVGGLTKDNSNTAGGKVVLGNDNDYEGPTVITAGILELASTGQISTDSAITNDDTFQVNGGTHTLGVIDGIGTMNVMAGSDVTASSIVQGTLIIGGDSLGATAAAVPEPSVWLLMVLGGGLFALFLRRKAA